MSASTTMIASCLPAAQGRPANAARPAAMIVSTTPPSAATEHRPDQEDRSARRSQEVREHGAEPEHPGVHERRARERPLHVDTAADHEQGADDHDEPDILMELLCQHRPAGVSERDPEVPQ